MAEPWSPRSGAEVPENEGVHKIISWGRPLDQLILYSSPFVPQGLGPFDLQTQPCPMPSRPHDVLSSGPVDPHPSSVCGLAYSAAGHLALLAGSGPKAANFDLLPDNETTARPLLSESEPSLLHITNPLIKDFNFFLITHPWAGSSSEQAVGFGHKALSIKRKGSVLLPWTGLGSPFQIGSLSQPWPEAGGCLSGAITASSLGGPHLGLGAKGSEVRGAGPVEPTS